ncbi:MAG TPA: hypothetical protein VFA32_18465 [Dehalococcoidia bacterium]|nr:hypothetical protein [Dehalococcoidia bacterium]
MATHPLGDFTALATRLVSSCAERDFISMAERLLYLDPAHVDVFVYIHTPTAHLSIVGGYRSLYPPEDPHAIQREPSASQIAQVLAEVAR